MRSGCTPLRGVTRGVLAGTPVDLQDRVSATTAPCERRPPRSSLHQGAGRLRAGPTSTGRSDHERVRIRRRRVGHRPRHLGPSRRRGVPVRRADGDGPRPRLAGRVRDGRGEARHAQSRRGRRGVWPRNAPPSWPAAWRSSASPSTAGSATGTASVRPSRPQWPSTGCARSSTTSADTVLTFGETASPAIPTTRRCPRGPPRPSPGRAPPRARLLHSTVPARRVPMEGPRRQPGRLPARYPVATPDERLAVDLVLLRTSPPAGSRRWRPRRPRRPAFSPPWASTAIPRRSATSPSSSTSGRHRSPSDRPRGSRAREVPLDGPPRDLEDGVPPGDGDGGRRRVLRGWSRAGASGDRSEAASSSRRLLVAEPAEQVGQVARRRPLVGPVAGAREVVDDLAVAGQGLGHPAGAARAASSPTDATPTRKVAPDARQLDGSDVVLLGAVPTADGSRSPR